MSEKLKLHRARMREEAKVESKAKEKRAQEINAAFTELRKVLALALAGKNH